MELFADTVKAFENNNHEELTAIYNSLQEQEIEFLTYFEFVFEVFLEMTTV